MNLTVYPGNPLRGSLGQAGLPDLPGDKSLSHRAALFAALAVGRSVIENFQVSGVTRAMLTALSALGVGWELTGDTLIIESPGISGWRAPSEPINCGNSATTIRLLAGALAASGLPAILDGSAGLRRRPMDRIVAPLRALGVPVQAAANGGAPLVLAARPLGQPLHSLTYTLPVASAQVKSCLLLAGLAAGGPVTLIEPGPSRDHTERMLTSQGAQLQTVALNGGSSFAVTLQPSTGKPLHPLQMRLPGDISAAAFLLVAALITPGSQINLTGVGLNPTRTGLLDALQAMGAAVTIEPTSVQAGEPVGRLSAAYSPLQGIEISGELVVRMIDEFPIFSIAAAYAQSTSQVRDALELRHKESDRITALCAELAKVGVLTSETPDGFSVLGGQPAGGICTPHGDHRLAMSLAIAGLAARAPITVQQAEIIHESFPGFAATLTALGANLLLEDGA